MHVHSLSSIFGEAFPLCLCDSAQGGFSHQLRPCAYSSSSMMQASPERFLQQCNVMQTCHVKGMCDSARSGQKATQSSPQQFSTNQTEWAHT